MPVLNGHTSFFPKRKICVLTVSSSLQPSHASIEQWIYSFCREKQTITHPRALPLNRQTDTDRNYVLKLVLVSLLFKKREYMKKCTILNNVQILFYYNFIYIAIWGERLLNKSFLVDNKMFQQTKSLSLRVL